MTLETFLACIVATLAVYRVSHIITREDGPFDLFMRLRSWIGLPSRNWFAKGFNCILCVSFWLAFGLAALLGWAWWMGLGIAGGVQLIDRWVRLL